MMRGNNEKTSVLGVQASQTSVPLSTRSPAAESSSQRQVLGLPTTGTRPQNRTQATGTRLAAHAADRKFGLTVAAFDRAIRAALRADMTWREARRQFSRQLLTRVLLVAWGNKNQAARVLGVHRTSLDDMLLGHDMPHSSAYWKDYAIRFRNEREETP